MKINPYIVGYFLGAALFCFSSCDPDNFSQVVEIEIPEHQSKLAVRGIFNQSDTLLEVFVSNSLSILANEDFLIKDNAIVSLFENDQLLYSLPFNDFDRKYQYRPTTAFGQTGALYRLEVSTAGYPSIKATQQMPGAVPILSAKVKSGGAITSDGEKVDAIDIEFKDPAGVENFYAIRASSGYIFFDGQDTIQYFSELYLDSNDPLLSYTSNAGLILQDAAFDGRTYQLKMYTYDSIDNRPVTIQLFSISKDTYLFYKSLNNYYDSIDNPFAEPVNVHNNIEGGYGIFGLTSVSEILIE